MKSDTFYTNIFWIATVSFFLLSFVLVISNVNLGSTFHLQVFTGFLMFATSKIGRKFLGLE
jgi:hypothetical protein